MVNEGTVVSPMHFFIHGQRHDNEQVKGNE